MIRNCTPHPINLQGAEELTFAPSGVIPRVSTIEVEAENVDGIPTVSQSTGDVEGLPEPQAGVFLVVSGMVFQASNRQDLLAPDTGKTAIRDEQGRIIAVKRFLRKGH